MKNQFGNTQDLLQLHSKYAMPIIKPHSMIENIAIPPPYRLTFGK